MWFVVVGFVCSAVGWSGTYDTHTPHFATLDMTGQGTRPCNQYTRNELLSHLVTLPIVGAGPILKPHQLPKAEMEMILSLNARAPRLPNTLPSS